MSVFHTAQINSISLTKLFSVSKGIKLERAILSTVPGQEDSKLCIAVVSGFEKSWLVKRHSSESLGEQTPLTPPPSPSCLEQLWPAWTRRQALHVKSLQTGRIIVPYHLPAKQQAPDPGKIPNSSACQSPAQQGTG